MVTVDVNCLWNLCFKLVIYVLVKQQVLRWVVCVWQNCLIKWIDDFMQYKQQGAVTHRFCFLLFRAVNCTQIIYAFYVLCICGCNGYLQLHYRLRCLNPFVYVTAVFFFVTPWYNFVAISFFRKTFASHNLRWCHYLLHIVKQTALWCSETFNSFRSSHTAQPVCLILAREKCSIFSGEKKNRTSSLYLAWMLLFDVRRKLRFGFVRFDTFVGDE